jgi:uncharacterized RmlC-like cupin family protein
MPMAGIQLKRMNWTRMPTAWEQTMQWREKQQRVAERMEQLNAANSGFSNAALNNISESGALAIKMAIARNQAEAKAKAEEAAKMQTDLLA